MKKWMKGLSLLLLAGALAGCSANAQAPVPELLEPVGVKLDTVTVKLGEIYELQAFDYAVVAETEELYFSRDGVIAEVSKALGQQVKAGDELASLVVEDELEEIKQLDHQREYLLADNALTLEMMRMDIELCRYQMENRDYKPSGEREQLKENELEQLETALRQEEERQALELEQLAQRRQTLQAQVDSSVLTAPVDGRIVYRENLLNGSSIQGGETLLILADEAHIKLKGAFVSQSLVDGASEIWALIGGERVEIEYEAMDREEYVSLLLTGAEMDAYFTFKGGVPAGVQLGDYAAVMVKTRARQDVIWIPPNSLYHDATGYYVFRASGESRERVNVTVGYRNTTAVEITEGLAEGDVVYVQ